MVVVDDESHTKAHFTVKFSEIIGLVLDWQACTLILSSPPTRPKRNTEAKPELSIYLRVLKGALGSRSRALFYMSYSLQSLKGVI